MLPIKTILHPTDFSTNSQNAWEVACALAHDYGARLLLIHVEQPQPRFAELGAVPPLPIDRTAVERELGKIKAPEGDATVVVRRLLIGDEASEITRFAEENHVDLIVMGTHGHTGISRLFLGSVAEKTLRAASCPVLTIKAPMNLRPGDKAPVENCAVDHAAAVT